jgi:hypothetical protein
MVAAAARLFLCVFLQAHRALCLPEQWVDGSGQDGACGVLVSGRRSSWGMFGAGYEPCTDQEPFCAALPTPVGDLSWSFPVSRVTGWFVTAESGTMTGPGESHGCDSFRAAAEGTAEEVVWTAPGPGTYRVEGSFAFPMGVIYYYGHTIEIGANGSSVTHLV